MYKKFLIGGLTLSIITLIGLFLFWMEPRKTDIQTISSPQHPPETQSSGMTSDPQEPVPAIKTLISEVPVPAPVSHSPLPSPHPEKTVSKLVFQKPNTEWKTRTLSGITYVFGEGNPKEVAVPMDKIQDFFHCKPPYTIGNEGYCPERSYLTPEVEEALKNMLESPLWGEVASNCRESFRSTGGVEAFDTDFVTGKMLDINSLLYVNPIDGTKGITQLYNISSFIDSEPRGDALAPVLRESVCYKDRVILANMANNVLGAYNAGALAQAQ